MILAINIIYLSNYIYFFRFYFPAGNPAGKTTLDGILKKFTDAFSKHKNQAVNLEQLGQLLKVTVILGLGVLVKTTYLCS